MIPPPVEERLRAHVASVLGAAHVPRSQRADLEDELYGHLVERWQALVADGVEPMAAAERALADFGTAGRIGRDLTRTYRGRFWASTIGVLLPAERPESVPWSIGARVLASPVLLLSAVATGSAVEALTGLPPLRGLLQGLAWGSGGAILLLVCLALLRGQRWALGFAIVLCVLSAIDGIATFITAPSTIDIVPMLSVAALIIALLDRQRVAASTSAGGEPSRWLIGAIAAILVASAVSGPVLAAFPGDPTQASEADLDLLVRAECDTTFERSLNAEVPRWRVDVFWDWSRMSVLPGGLRGWERYTDMLVLRHPGEEWTLIETSGPEEAMTQNSIGWQGAGQPAVGAIPSNLQRGVIDFAILTRSTHPGVRYHAEWTFIGQTTTHGWPDEAEAWYFHGDHWSLVARAGCDDSGLGHPPGAQQP